MPQVSLVSPYDDLEALVSQINAAKWDELNAIEGYVAEALNQYLEKQGTRFVICRVEGLFAGMASARIEHKPYDMSSWLYIDEVDVAVNFRRKGVGTAIMRALLELAREEGCKEVWLGTELENQGATRFYPTLNPNEIEQFFGYTFFMKGQ